MGATYYRVAPLTQLTKPEKREPGTAEPNKQRAGKKSIMKNINYLKQQFTTAMKTVLTTPVQGPDAGIVLTIAENQPLGIAYAPVAVDNDEQLVLYTATECGAAAQTVEGREFGAALPELDKCIADDIENNLASLLGDIRIASLRAKPAAQRRITELHGNLADQWNQNVTI